MGPVSTSITMKKLSDFKKDKALHIRNQIDVGSKQIGMDESVGIKETFVGDFGICTDYRHLRAARTKYGKIYAECDSWEKRLNGVDLIERCTHYEKRGQMDLYDMQQVAVIIDIHNHKKAGLV